RESPVAEVPSHRSHWLGALFPPGTVPLIAVPYCRSTASSRLSQFGKSFGPRDYPSVALPRRSWRHLFGPVLGTAFCNFSYRINDSVQLSRTLPLDDNATFERAIES